MMHPHDVLCPTEAALIHGVKSEARMAEAPSTKHQAPEKLQAPTSKLWSVFRFKGGTNRGRVYPLRLEYKQPVTEAAVRLYCITEKRFGNQDFKPFNHFAIFIPERLENRGGK
jgi:hypothetical protein